jgi:hypothetical protein
MKEILIDISELQKIEVIDFFYMEQGQWKLKVDHIAPTVLGMSKKKELELEKGIE